MKRRVRIFGWLTAMFLTMPSMSGQARAASPANLLCSEGKIICVAESVERSLIANPLKLDVTVNSSIAIEVNWQIVDSNGKILDSSTPGEYIYDPTASPRSANPLRIQDFIFTPATSAKGTLILNPSRYTVTTGWSDLPGIQIPVRLTTATTMVTVLEPENPAALTSALEEWMDEEHHRTPDFAPTLKLVPHGIAIMRVERNAMVGATAEAVFRSFPGQSPWHARDWSQAGNTAHITIDGDGWAGVSFYMMEVTYRLEKSVLNLPGIKKFVLDTASH